MNHRILIIDDEFLIRYTLSEGLGDLNYQVQTAENIKEGLALMKAFRPEVLLLDNRLEEALGIDHITMFKEMDENLQIILMTAYGSVSQAVDAIKKGAFHYILKPFDMEEMNLLIQRALDQTKDKTSLELLKLKPRAFLGESKAVEEIRRHIQLLGENDQVDVLIRGETGTGKEVVASLIHAASKRRDNLMIRINCGAIPENLVESELFGYEKGAFTGALKRKKGLIELGDGGTVFLDEVGELPMNMQVKLLTFLDDRKFKRVGGLDDIQVNTRILAATNKDLEQAIAEGTFREDLFYRLNVMQIVIPPLRQRPEDVPLLCNYYLDYYNKKFAKNIQIIEPAFMAELMAYDWKGNVRELKNIIERCFLFSNGTELKNTVQLAASKPAREQSCSGIPPAEALPIDLEALLSRTEKQYIHMAMTQSKGNMSKAAELLNISRFALKRKLEKYPKTS